MENKYLGSTGLAKFLENLYNVFSPVGHSHTKSQITDFPTIPTEVSQLNNDSGYVTAEDISNLEISVDTELSESSENPVQNKVINEAINDLVDQIKDASSIDIDLDGDGSNIGEAPLVNANTLNGKHESELYVNNSDRLGGIPANEYAKKSEVMVQTNYCIIGDINEPTDRTENMIWIETDVPIGRVFFGKHEPRVELHDNDVWIYTGDVGIVTFNALKIGDNYLNPIYPISANQIIDGVFVKKPTKSWQNNRWVNWIPARALFYDGYTADELTGGWTHEGYTYYQSTYTMVEPVITDTLYVEITYSTAACVAGTKNKVDLTNVTKIYAECTEAVGNSFLSICSNTNTYNYLATVKITTPGIIELPINSTITSGYIVVGIGGSGSNSSAKVRISRIWLE